MAEPSLYAFDAYVDHASRVIKEGGVRGLPWVYALCDIQIEHGEELRWINSLPDADAVRDGFARIIAPYTLRIVEVAVTASSQTAELRPREFQCFEFESSVNEIYK